MTNNHLEDEITLKELILILLKGFKLILASTLIFLLVGVIFYYVFQSTIYSSNINARYNILNEIPTEYGVVEIRTETYDSLLTLYGEYELLSYLANQVNHEILASEILEVLQIKLSNSKQLSLIAKSDNKDLNQTIIQSYQSIIREYANYRLQKDIITILYGRLEQLAYYQSLIDFYQQKVNETNPLLFQNSQNTIINPQYSYYSVALLEAETNYFQLFLRNEPIAFIKEQLNSLQQNHSSFEVYLSSSIKLHPQIITITFVEPIEVNETKTQNLALTISISTILGMMLGVFVVLFKNYWESE